MERRRRLNFRILGSDDLLGGAPPTGCWCNTISGAGVVLIEEIVEGDRTHPLVSSHAIYRCF